MMSVSRISALNSRWEIFSRSADESVAIYVVSPLSSRALLVLIASSLSVNAISIFAIKIMLLNFRY